MDSMPLDLTDAELATAATAFRAMAYQEGERAKKMEKPLPEAAVSSPEANFRPSGANCGRSMSRTARERERSIGTLSF
jgi:hypothetical protein